MSPAPAAPTVPRSPAPWAALPAGIATLLRPEIPGLTEEIIRAVQEGIPEFGRLDPPYVQTIKVGVERALGQFVDQIADPTASHDTWAETCRNLGRGEMREGRSLDALQAAYRLGARMAWRRTAKVSVAASLSPEQLCLLAEAVFAHVDRMASYSVEGYTAEQASVAGTLYRRRRRLLELILVEPPASTEVLAGLAASAAWELPTEIAAVALEDDESGRDLELGAEILLDLERPDPFLLVPDPGEPGRLTALTSALGGRTAVLGPTVPLSAAGRSLRWARETHALIRRGVVDGDGTLVRSADHLSTMMLATGEGLLQELAARRLAPLGRVTPKARDKLAETLLAWLETGGAAAPEVAARLRVHPQTVRYRLHQLEDLFGEALHDLQSRFELRMVLRAWRLFDRPRSEPGPAEVASAEAPAGTTACPQAREERLPASSPRGREGGQREAARRRRPGSERVAGLA